jgi:hypothetical protein
MAPHHITARQLTHELLDRLTHEEIVAVGLVLNELVAAKRAWPEWPKDLVYGAAVVAEEAGELVQATLNAHFKGTRRDLAKKEAEQTAVTAIRFISNFPVELPL